MDLAITVDLQEYQQSLENELQSLMESTPVLITITESEIISSTNNNNNTQPPEEHNTPLPLPTPIEVVVKPKRVKKIKDESEKIKRVKKEPDNNPFLLRNINYQEAIGDTISPVLLEYNDLKQRMNWIDQQPVHEQRSEEWHLFRNQMITASEIFKLFASQKAIKTFIENKIHGKKYKSGKSCLHGIRYEPLAREIYEKRNQVKIHEYGCIQHRNIPHLGASPDGICIGGNPLLYGRLVEIKCPISRVIDGMVPIEYAIQVQIQLEVLNMEECDYCEFKFQEFTSKELYLQSENPERGITLSITDEGGEQLYINSEFAIQGEFAEDWIVRHTEHFLHNPNIHLNKIYFWYIEQYHCKTIRRNRAFFEFMKTHIDSVWTQIEEHKKTLSL